MKILHRKLLLALCSTVLSLVLVYLVSLFLRSWPYYRDVKGFSRSWSEWVHRGDPELGFAHLSNQMGSEVFPIGPPLPFRLDSQGFKVPVDKGPTPRKHPVILALGCSYTFGYGVPAEQTYPYQVARLLGGSEINTGSCGYGLSQMMILSQRLIPSLRPDFVIVQYSPWLVDRSLTGLAPSRSDACSVPYFYNNKNGSLRLQFPTFEMCEDPHVKRFRNHERGPMEFLAFFTKVGLPLFLRSDWKRSSFRAKQWLGILPKPAKDRDEVVCKVYREIFDLCRNNGAEMIILLLGVSYDSLPTCLRQSGVTMVDGQAVLYNRLATKNEEGYLKEYGQWRGDPPVLVDRHPNGKAYEIIAEVLAETIRRKVDSKREGP